ncbi:MAG: hypothetical protein HY885_04315 [Deltaproteobacteria bacterium]|nr:hypothetical protein [Deltaproteobacteria bacterium]
MKLAEVRGDKLMAFVSEDCPVSLVATVIQARQSAGRHGKPLVIVVPLQPLSDKHFAMNRLIRNGNLLFVRDEKWRRDKPARRVKLPLFLPLGDNAE